ncbi:MAG: CPBP family intramembrane metalloprotease [Aphanocapsa lilacina HA4352-LM1]|jgi:membrane protease YdiL (CAAX protease family)|nr:CPBP family intramembrane metalloprotease [Aphanocapsa lilacina HA4352-LM1]
MLGTSYPDKRMMRRALLVMTTVLVLLLGGSRFVQTLQEPQPRAQLALEGTDLQLQLLTLKTDPDWREAMAPLDERQLLSEAVEAYREAKLEAPARPAQLVKLGLLEAARGNTEQAQTAWRQVEMRSPLGPTAEVLADLWARPPILPPEAENMLESKLAGWYRTAALTRLYQLQQRSDALRTLQAEASAEATRTLVRLGVLNLLPLAALVAGLVILGSWVVWRNRRPEPPEWQAPWSVQTVWEVMVYWFAAFFSAGLVVGALLSGLRAERADPLFQALFTLLVYGLIAGAGLGLLWSLVWKPHPESRALFSYRLVAGWERWGIGGWLAAVPLVLATSLLAQRLVGEGGGGNSLLTGIGGADAWPVRIVLFVSVAIAAPLFEETLFRGFVFPSLASRLGAPAGVVASASLFGIAHFSALEFFPLFALGVVLATVYHYTRSLAPCILLHSLWNGSTFLFLTVLSG